MGYVINWLDAVFSRLPQPLLGVWGRFAYIVGFVLAISAFGGFTFRPGGRWGLGRERQAWDAKAVLSMSVTFILIIVTGYVGSFVVLVPGAQTFESLKDLMVFLCIVLFGYPALITVPFAYALSDLIEGVPPDFLLDWLPGYFINPACFWVAYQFVGRNPDFRRARTWGGYLVFVLIFMGIEPALWGYVCAGKFTPEISFGNITPALFFTTGVTWIMAPFAMLAALPLARKYGMFWAEIPGHVKERLLGRMNGRWEAGIGEASLGMAPATQGWPIRMILLTPFIALVLLMVGATAYVTLRSAASDGHKLAARLHQEISDNINLQLDEYLAQKPDTAESVKADEISALLKGLPVAQHGFAMVVHRDGSIIASSARKDNPVVVKAVARLRETAVSPAQFKEGFPFSFKYIYEKPLSRQIWLACATAYEDRRSGHADWIVLTLMPESYYLAGVQAGNSRSAMVFALALLLSLAVAALLSTMVTNQLRRIALATQALSDGNLDQRAPGSRMEELDILARSFNDMAERLKKSFGHLNGEIELRKKTEESLRMMQFSVDHAGDSMFWVNREGRILYVNDAACTGRGYTREELLGMKLFEVNPDFSPEKLEQTFQELQQRGTLTLESRHRAKDGTVFPVEVSITHVSMGGQEFAFSTVRDISERKRATEQLEMLKVSIDRHLDGAFWMDTNNRFVYVNDSACKNLGYTREELLGQPVTLVSPRVTPQSLEEVWKSLRETAFFARESVHRRKDGSEFPVEIVASYVRFDGKELNCGFARDITERRRLEQKQAELAAIVASSDDAIIGKSLSGIITSWNRGAEKIFGYSAAEAVGRPLLMLIPADRHHEEPEILATIGRGGTVEHFETVRVCKDGRQIHISATISPLKDSRGKVTGASKIARDITEQKRADEALREKQSQLILAMDIAKLAHWEFDVVNNIVTADEHTFQLLGTTSEQEGALSMSPEEYIRKFVHPEDAGIVASEVALGVATTDPTFARQFEHRIIHKDGTERVMMVRSRIIMDAAGRTHKILGTNQDITEQKQAGLRIQHLNRVYEVLSDINKTIVREKDPQVMLAEACRVVVEKGEFQMAWVGMFDAAAQKVLPVTSAGVVEGYLDLLNVDLRDEERSSGPSGRCFLSGEHAICSDIEHDSFVATLRDEALKRGYRSSACFPLKVGGRVAGIFSLYSDKAGFFDEEEVRLLDELALDIGFALEVGEGESKRRQAEQELRWRTAFFEAQVHSAIDGILVVDGEGKKLLQNRRLNELWKIPAPIADDPDDSKQFQFILGRVRAPEAFAEKTAYLKARPDESSSDVIELVDGTLLERYSAPVRGSDGKYYGRVWTFHDITERRKLEQQFLRAQRMESIGTLASGVAHDLNNILTPIMMSVPVLRLNISEKQREEIIDTIEMSVGRGAQIVKQVLTFGRGLDGEKHPLQVQSLISEMVKMISGTFPKDIAVVSAVEPHLWKVLGDATQLHQVLLNLCVNARDAMLDGGTLRLSAANLDIDVSYASMLPESTSGPHVLLEVSDTGSGIPPEILERIFDPFFTTKGVGKGTGLGLSTVHGIVKNHGGLLKVVSQPGKGTTFQVYLPAAPDQEAFAAATSAEPLPTGNGELVLVVDDEPAITEAARTVLEAHGYRVLLATNGAEAIAMFEQNSNDVAVVLADVMMPFMNGVTLLHALRRIRQDLPMIASTGLGEKAHLDELEEMGIETTLRKPYNSGTLLRAIHGMVRLKAAD